MTQRLIGQERRGAGPIRSRYEKNEQKREQCNAKGDGEEGEREERLESYE